MPKLIAIGNTRLDVYAQRVYVDDTIVRLSQQEYLILEYMLTRREKVWRQDDLKTYLFEFVYYGALPTPRSRSWLYVQLSNIRKKIQAAGSNMLIKGDSNRGGYTISAHESAPH